jgi:transposase-like protein
MGKRVQRSYTINDKLEILDWLETGMVAEVAREAGIPYDTVRSWQKNADRIRGYTGSGKAKTVGRQGRRELVPFSHDLVIYMKDVRRDEEVRLIESICIRYGAILIQKSICAKSLWYVLQYLATFNSRDDILYQRESLRLAWRIHIRQRHHRGWCADALVPTLRTPVSIMNIVIMSKYLGSRILISS